MAANVFAGCGDDDNVTDAAATDASADAATGAGSGGSGMMSGAGGSTSNMSSAPPPVMCGGRRCIVPLQTEYNLLAGFAQSAGVPLPNGGAGILPTACCTAKMVCGLEVQGMGCVPPPPHDANCPDVTVLSVTTAGCCLESQGICGANGAQSGLGCVDISALGPLLGLPDPKTCGTPTADAGHHADAGHDAGHPHEDAGSEDAGH